MMFSSLQMGAATGAGLEPAESNLALWHRPERSAFRGLLRYYERAETKGLIDRDLIAAIVDAAKIDRRQLASNLPPVPGRLFAARSAFAEELSRLTEVFAEVAGTTTVRIKLEVERGDRCRYFHTDRIGLRLLCTYMGPGTEWVPDEFADRSALRGGDNAAIVPDPRRVKRLAPFWIGLFKGDLHPDCSGRGCIHRSPPFGRPRNAARILLTIDNPVDDD
jgi:hypothetical protein